MKAFIIAFLLLIPIALADPILEAKHAQLESNAAEVIIQMDALIGFAKNESISVDDLTKTRDSFQSKLHGALQTTTIDTFNNKTAELKQLVTDFRTTARSKLGSVLSLAKQVANVALEQAKAIIKDKKQKALEKKTTAITNALDARIAEIQKHLEDQRKLGKEPLSYKVLLDKYEQQKTKLNETNSGFTDVESSAQSIESFISNFWTSITSFGDSIKEKAKAIQGKKNETN